MSNIQLFNNGEFELCFTADGDSFTVEALGLARALSVRDGYTLVRNLPDTEKRQHVLERADSWFVTEPGFYRVLGQRQPARIKDPTTRTQVERFQNWIYREVLPAIRRTGRYERLVDPFEPITYTWDEVTAVIRQRHGINMPVATLTRMLRTAGVLKQNGAPRKAHAHMFWFTGSHWAIHPHAVPLLLRKAEDVGRELREFRFLQTRLELDGVGRNELRTA